MNAGPYTSLESAVKGCFGENVYIEKSSGLFLSDINSVKTLYLSNGKKVFLKLNSAENIDIFRAEEEGLQAIKDTGTIKIPCLFCKGTDEETGVSFLMMEKIETGRSNEHTWRSMGYAFAAMHLADTDRFVSGGKYGFLRDNYIGSSKQINDPNDSWIDFFRECRLKPQFIMAEKSFDHQSARAVIKLMDRLDSILSEPEYPSLLHGDMWGGNYLVGKDGKAVLIDPAAYVGHSEADIAMTQMFCPMPPEFYEAYYEKIPRQAGYEDRREIYNLYHILNHFNLFGGDYLMWALRIIRHFTG